MNAEWEEWLATLGEPCGSKPVPDSHYERFAEVFPPLLFEVWRRYGLAGFGQGRVWLVDPVEWAPIVQRWLDGVEFAMGEDRWHATTRDAFGGLGLWGERTGRSLEIKPVYGWLIPSGRTASMMGTERQRNIQVFVQLSSGMQNNDLANFDGVQLFDDALRRLGPVGPDTIYGLVPAAALGGPISVDHLEITDALSHVEFLTDIGVADREILGDITMSV